MNLEAVQRLREPAAWILVGSAGLQLLAGIVMLFSGGGFKFRAFSETTGVLGGNFFSHVAVTALLVVAVLLVTGGTAATPQARMVVMGALGVLGGIALFSLITWLGSLIADIDGVDVFESGGAVKFAAFLYGAGKLAVVGVAGWYMFTVFQSIQPVRRPAPQQQVPPNYPDYGYQQQGQPPQYGQQAAYPQQQYEQPQQQYEQQQGYEQQGYEQQQQQGYGQQYQQPQPQQQYEQPQQQYEQPQQQYEQYDQYGGQQAQQQYGQGGYQQPAEEESAGEWTRAYGDDQQQAYPQEQQGDWYRDNRQ